MTKKITNISEQRRKLKARTMTESAKIAARRFLDKKYDDVEEPKGLASGKAGKNGSLVNDEENPCDD